MPHLMYVGFGIWTAILGGSFYFARRFVRAIERRRDDAQALSKMGDRLAAIEDSLDALRDDVTRLEAHQDFTARLLESRPRKSDSVAPPSPITAEHNDGRLTRGN